MGVIKKIIINSLAEELGLDIGDVVTKINGKDITDIVDYYYLMSDEFVCIEVQKINGDFFEIEVDKEEDELLGVEWEQPTIDKIKTCHNDCIFCFVKQSPQGIRDSLQIKDDDYRLSFLHGNYISLTNVSDKELQRIVNMRMSPINISVHTTNPRLRREMLNNKNAGNIMQQLKFLVENEIEINTQIVLCPGINDQLELEHSINDLLSLQPMLKSISVVPVGLTNYRENLTELRLISKDEAVHVIKKIEKYQLENLKKHQRSTIYAADEFYVIADYEVPNASFYDCYEQLENGVGLIRLFKEQFNQLLNLINDNPDYKYNNNNLLLLTGVSAYNVVNDAIKKLASITGVNIECCAVPNNYYGAQVTVTGLVTASDILNLLKCQKKSNYFNKYDIIILPEVMFKEDSEIFLDDIELEQLKKLTGKDFFVISNDPISLIDIILEKRS